MNKTNIRRYHYVLAPESDNDSTSGTETIYSMQDKETEYVRDESDTCTKSDSSEYTMNSNSTEINPFINTESSDEIIRTENLTVFTHIDIDVSGSETNTNSHETDNSSSTTDSELGQADYWNCIQCLKSNNHPKYRYCMKCFQLRKESCTPRPKGTKKRNELNNSITNIMPIINDKRKANKRKYSTSSDDNYYEKYLGSNKTIKLNDKQIKHVKNKEKINNDINMYKKQEQQQQQPMLQSTSNLCSILNKFDIDSQKFKSSDFNIKNNSQIQNNNGAVVESNKNSNDKVIELNENLLLQSSTNLTKFFNINIDSQKLNRNSQTEILNNEIKNINDKYINENQTKILNSSNKVIDYLNNKYINQNNVNPSPNNQCNNNNNNNNQININKTDVPQGDGNEPGKININISTNETSSIVNTSNEVNMSSSNSINVSTNNDTPNSNSNNEALCIMCECGPKNGAFCHMYEVHICCCYKCAIKAWKTTKKCPLCNLRASKVVKVIIS